MKIVEVNCNGNAPRGCKKGTLVITATGTYKIVSWWIAFWKRKARYNPDSGYWSEKVSEYSTYN